MPRSGRGAGGGAARDAMFKKILVANRGEAAVRILRACSEMEIPSVAIYSDPDRSSLHVRFADEAYRVGPGPARDSYLKMETIIQIAKDAGAEAIHPGYGFLSENPAFAQLCADSGVVFIGPTPQSIRAMGDKVEARKVMEAAGVPVVPGVSSELGDEEAVREIKRIGLPVMVKAAAGGGGKGLRLVREESQIASALRASRSEAKSAFANPAIYIEKYLDEPRHVEVQVLGDRFGNLIHVGERDCSIQRRHQKVIEECPAPGLSDELRQAIREAGVRAARAVDYESAGTVEFLLDKSGEFYFLEMNTRIQVEHAITERTTGIDLVKAQIRIAAGEKLWIDQSDVVVRGSAIECRIYAEDPYNNFMPSPGTITVFRVPGGPGVRLDSGVYGGFTVPVEYDPMVAKLIAHGGDRREAIDRITRALREFTIKGIKTSLPFHLHVMKNKQYIRGDINTTFIEREFLAKGHAEERTHDDIALLAVGVAAFRRDREEAQKRMSTSGNREDSPWRQAARQAGIHRFSR
jgi:acetyl-CoA carboxylase biotin carboxylase subunit